MIIFEINGQSLKRIDDFVPATDSQSYLKAKFNFKSSDWNGKTKSEQSSLGDSVYSKLIGSDGTCIVPTEVLVHANSRYARLHGSAFSVSVIGEQSTTRITTNEIEIKLKSSGYGDVETPSEPTETMYQQILTAYGTNTQAIEEATTETNSARDDLVGVKNIFANAIKGKLSGAVVRADDVSPIEHNPVVWVHGKNLFSTNEKTVELDAAYGGLLVPFKGEAGKRYTVSANYEQIGTQTRIGISINTYKGKWITETYKDATSGLITISFDYPEMFDDESYVTIGFFSNLKSSAVAGAKCKYTNIQVEKGSIATPYEPWIDPTDVTVRMTGSNILSLPYYDGTSKTHNGITFTVQSDGSVKAVGTATHNAYFNLSKFNFNPIHDLILFKDCAFNRDMANLLTSLCVNAGDTVDKVFNPKVYLKTESNTFETPDPEVKITPSADGTVEGITTLSPTMTLMIDTEGAIIDCEYIRDTNKVLERLEAAIVELGGTI